MTFAGVFAGAAQGHLVVNRAVVADLGGFAEHDAHAVVNEQAAPDFGAGVNFNAGKAAAPLADHAGQEKTLMTVQPMRRPMKE